MDPKELAELRDYYDNTDTSAEIKDAEWNDAVVQSPMVGITVRFPAVVLQQIRAAAAAQRVKPTALIRGWVEERLQPQRASAAPKRSSISVQQVTSMNVHTTVLLSRFDDHTDASETFTRRAAAKALERV